MELLNISLLKGAFVTEYRVITALMLREIHTIYGNSRIGYLWVLIQSAFNIGVFWAIREIAGASSPHGMSIAMFLIAGFGIWNVASSCISKHSIAHGIGALFPEIQHGAALLMFCEEYYKYFIRYSNEIYLKNKKERKKNYYELLIILSKIQQIHLKYFSAESFCFAYSDGNLSPLETAMIRFSFSN